MDANTQTFWRIEGFDGLTRIFEQTIPSTHITTARLEEMLRTLVAMHGKLTDQELVASFLRLNIKGRQAHLDGRRSASLPPSFTCGDNPHFIATAIRSTKSRPKAAGR